MAEGEKKHVKEFNRLIKDKSIRPTAITYLENGWLFIRGLIGHSQ